MENQGKIREGIKADIQQLKEQMSQSLEALNALQSPGDSCAQRPQQRVPKTQTFPSYDLPPNYTPPSEMDLRHLNAQKSQRGHS
ncbi:hypothetical protein LR48_Vigan07g166900 [Vigna angularis]|uniref:Uncharacterized protein n=1 Tax=Phaseolus angularis TaxID=3914 RepID=A0A0L9UYQ4_PHAAN|nr:hypothetical protein LR48_Vigan07g166900 [Vigna angularis]